MSDNNLSIDEIIKRAEIIKAQAEQQLSDAQRNLEEMANSAIEEVNVDAKAVMEKVEHLSAEEEDIKEFSIPKSKHEKEKTRTIKLNFGKSDSTKVLPKIKAERILDEDDDADNDDDMKIADAFDKTMRVPSKAFEENEEDIFEDQLFPSQKTKPVILSTNNNTDDDQLQEVPTLVARENLGNYLDGDDVDSKESAEEIGIQMTFDGFDDVVEEVPTIDEALAEQILQEQRKEKVNKFRLFGPDETDEALGDEEFEEKDYKTENDQQNIFAGLFRKRKILIGQTITTFILGIIMLYMTIFKNTEYFPQALASSKAFFVTGLILAILSIIINFNVIIHGFNLKKGINCDFPTSILAIVILGQSIAFVVNSDLWLDNGVFLGSVLALALIFSQLGKRQIIARIIDNFDFIINSKEKFCMENIANALDVKVLSRGNLDEESPIIKTSVQTDFPTNFMEISCKTEPSNDVVKILTPINVLLSIILLIVIGLMDNWGTAINMSVCALAISSPVALLFLMNSLLYDMSGELDKNGARVCGFEGAQMISNTDAMVLESANLFSNQGCDLHGIKVFNKTKVDDAIIYTAAVIIKTKSPLAQVFDNVIIGKQSILPEVEDVQYEDQMGTSAWVYGRKVLVGNRNLLINHGVNVPKESFERKYTRKNRKALYLAVNGTIMAMFVVSYSADPYLKRELRKLEKTGITLIVKSSDPYINEESLANLFGLPRGYIRVMNKPAARVFEKYSDMKVEKSPAYMIHNGSAKGYISAMRGALTINNLKKVISFLVPFGCALGFLTIAILSLIGAYSQISAIAILSCWIIWNTFVFFFTKILRLGF